MNILQKPFNSDPAIERLVKNLDSDFGFERFIETGTYFGCTTKWFGETFPEKEVHTIDVNKQNYEIARRFLQNQSNITCHLGDSPHVLETLLQTNKKTFFYLDAHWLANWPLLGEIEMIGKYCKENCCIMIDDCQVPNRSYFFDRYKNQVLNLEYVLPGLQTIFTDPVIFFNDTHENSGRPVGKLVCFPKSWTTSLELNEENGYFYWKN